MIFFLGVNEKCQLDALNDMLTLVSNLYFKNARTGGLNRKPFQTGIIVGIKSVIALFNELKEEGLEY